MWYSKSEHIWGGPMYMGRKYHVGTDGLLSPQPGLEDIKDLMSMKTMPRHFEFRVTADTDPAEAELAGVSAPEAPAPEAPEKKATKSRAASKAAKESK